MKKLFFLFLTIFVGVAGNAQEDKSKLSITLGAGRSLLGTGDIRTVMFENELNYKLNKYFALGGGIAFGKSNYDLFGQASFFQLNSNIYLSPFRNNRKNDFRLGAGFSWYSVSDSYLSSATYQNGQIVNPEYVFDDRNSVGLNMLIENTYSVTDKYLLGLKVFAQPYLNGDINSGILLKLGMKF